MWFIVICGLNAKQFTAYCNFKNHTEEISLFCALSLMQKTWLNIWLSDVVYGISGERERGWIQMADFMGVSSPWSPGQLLLRSIYHRCPQGCSCTLYTDFRVTSGVEFTRLSSPDNPKSWLWWWKGNKLLMRFMLWGLWTARPHLSVDKHFLAQTGDLSWGDRDRGAITPQRETAQSGSCLWRRLHSETHQVQKRMACNREKSGETFAGTAAASWHCNTHNAQGNQTDGLMKNFSRLTIASYHLRRK